MFDRSRIWSLYDDQMRRDPFVPPGQRVERTPWLTVVSGGEPTDAFAAVVHSRLTAATADAGIAEAIERFGARGAVEWKLYEHDMPPDLGDRLKGTGWRAAEPEALLSLDLRQSALELSSGIEIQRLERPDELPEVVALNRAVFGEHARDLGAQLRAELGREPATLGIYVARWQGRVGAAGWIRFHPDRAFADLWGGGTHPECRHRGLYRSLVAARAEEARERGVRYLTVDASPASRPILEKLGFRHLAWITPFLHAGR